MSLMNAIDHVRRYVRDREVAHDEAVAKARRAGTTEPRPDLPRAGSPRHVRTAAKIMRDDGGAEPWYAHRDVREDWDPIGMLLSQLRAEPEFTTFATSRIDIRWSTSAWVEADIGGDRVILGRMAVVPAEERGAWPVEEDEDGVVLEAPMFRFKLSAPAFLLATTDEIERALHELLCQCGLREGRPVRDPQPRRRARVGADARPAVPPVRAPVDRPAPRRAAPPRPALGVHVKPAPTPLLSVYLAGEPARAKHACTCHGGHPGTRPLKEWAAWRGEQVATLREQFPGREPIAVPVFAQVVAVFARPQTKRTKYKLGGVERPYPFPWTQQRVGFVGRPDHDQVWKAGLDVLVQSGLLLDDPLVVGDHGSTRWYAASGEPPHVEVTLWEARPC